MKRLDVQRFRVRIWYIMTAIAVCAVGLASPLLAVIISALVAWWFLVLGILYGGSGRRVAEWVLVAIFVALLWGLCQPGITSRCRPRAPTVPTNGAPLRAPTGNGGDGSVP
jgi:hypothetical protein